MQYDEIKLSHIFREQEWHNEIRSKIEVREKISAIKEEIGKKEPNLNWEIVFGEIMEASTKLLDIKLEVILESTWDKYNEVQQYFDKEKYNSDEMFLIPLLEHTIVSSHHPKIEINLGEIHVADIDFEIVLTLFLSGIILKISQGKIQGLKAGKCKSKGTFSCEGVVLFEDESKEFVF